MLRTKEPAARLIYSFGAFQLDPVEHRLSRNGSELRLPPKVFETLVLLVERRGRLVEKDELMKALWPGMFVEEVTLAGNISRLRKALGDPSGQDESRYIETVSKRGYRFIADVTERVDAPEDRNQTAPGSGIAPQPTAARPSFQEQPTGRQPGRLHRAGWFSGGAISVIAGATMIAWVSLRTPHLNSPRSVAVMPFVDQSKDSSSEYMTDGITEGVIFKLSEIPGLRVISRNTAFRYKGKETDAQTIGRDLKVEAVLSGRIEHQADGVTINAELVSVKDGTQIWGQQFRYPVSDLARAQDELAAAILDKLKLELNGADEIRLARPATRNPEAYQLYLQARFHWNQRTPLGIKKSIDLFQQATEKDPNFALAYAGLADAYGMADNLGFLTPQESMPEAKAAATKALVLDPGLAEAHAALGSVKSHYDFDLPGAQREFLKAIELNPNYAWGHVYYAGGYLSPMGRHAEAIAEVKKAVELDPLSTAINNYMGETYVYAGDYQKAFEQFQHTIDLDPTFPLAHFFYGNCLNFGGKYEQAAEEYQKGYLLIGVPPKEVAADKAYTLKLLRTGGPITLWRKALKNTLKNYEHGTAGALELASAYAAAGNKEKALELLQKAYEERYNVTLVGIEPEFKSLHGDARFSAILKRIGLPE